MRNRVLPGLLALAAARESGSGGSHPQPSTLPAAVPTPLKLGLGRLSVRLGRLSVGIPAASTREAERWDPSHTASTREG